MADSEDQSGMVTVAKFFDPAEAQMARGALEAEGIDVFLQGENANNIMPMSAFARTSLQVGKQDEAAARELLASFEAPEGDVAE